MKVEDKIYYIHWQIGLIIQESQFFMTDQLAGSILKIENWQILNT